MERGPNALSLKKDRGVGLEKNPQLKKSKKLVQKFLETKVPKRLINIV
jgi:hypothetical protein